MLSGLGVWNQPDESYVLFGGLPRDLIMTSATIETPHIDVQNSPWKNGTIRVNYLCPLQYLRNIHTLLMAVLSVCMTPFTYLLLVYIQLISGSEQERGTTS